MNWTLDAYRPFGVEMDIAECCRSLGSLARSSFTRSRILPHQLAMSPSRAPGKGDHTVFRIGPREKGFQNTARLVAIAIHAPKASLEMTDGVLKKCFDFVVQVEEGDSEQGGQFRSDRALANATDACE